MNFPNLDRLGSITDLQSGDSWSGQKLRNEVAERANRLRELKIGPGARVLILHGQEPRFFADLLAVFAVGACAAILDSNSTESERRNIVGFLKPHWELPAVPGQALAEALTESHRAAMYEDPALILFTSGSTGQPKGVVHSFRSLNSRLRLNRAVLGDTRLARTLCMLPTHFGHGLIGNSLTPLLAGQQLFLTKFSGELAGKLPGLIVDQGITFMSSVPTMWRRILDESPRGIASQPSQLLRLQLGSAPLSADLWQQVIEWSGIRDVVNTYGITEAANWISGASAESLEPADGLIGSAWGGQLGVRQADGTVALLGEGELVVRSRALMTGYLERDDLTREAVENAWFRTGDTGRIDERGNATLSGRIKNEINRGGAKVQPEDVDLVLERHSEVLECCTFGVPDERLGERVGAAVCIRTRGDVDEEALKAWCAEHLRKHAIPEAWYFLEAIPKTDRGKVLRAKVRDYCLAQDGRQGAS